MAILIICLSIASYSGSHIMEKFDEINKHMSSSFTTASNFSVMVSMTYLNSQVKIGKRMGKLTDAYSSRQKTIFLSESTFDNSSVAALAIAAHELGHALQDQKTPQMLRKRETYAIISKLLGLLMYPLFIGAIICLFASEGLVASLICIIGAIFIFFFALFVKGMTIKIEKDASAKAVIFLKELNILEDDEIVYAKKLLKAALLTYIGDFLQAILGWTMLTRRTKLFGG